MSSRVQKGGQRFKPVVKPRGRTVEAAPNVSRKPPSARGATVEPLAPHQIESNNVRSQDAHVLSAPFSKSHSTLQQRDKHVLDNDLGNAKSGGRTRKPVSSSSAVGSLHEPNGAILPEEDDGQSRRAVEPSRSTSIHNAPPSPAIRSSSASRFRHAPSVRRSRRASATRPSVSIPTDDLERPEPTPHSYMQNIATVPVEASQSFSEETLSGAVDDSERKEDDAEEQVTRTIFLSGRQSRPSTRKLRPRTSPRGKGRPRKQPAPVDATSHDMDTRMTRSRKTRKEATEAPNDTMGSLQTLTDTGQTLRRSNRLRRSSVIVPEVHEPSDTVDTQDSASESEPRRKRRRHSSSVSSIPARRRSRNPIFFDPDADPGEELDPTVVTMAEICDDTRQGRISSKAVDIQRNHLAWRVANKEKREKARADEEAKKYGRNPDEDNTQGQAQASKETKEAESDGEESPTAESSTAVEDASGSGFNYKESLAVNRFSAQVRIGANGETIIDEESLVIDRAENAEGATELYQHVEESEQTKFTNSASYRRRPRGPRWSAEETDLFYEALQQFGENFELISYVLPGRDRKACKTKFKVEDNKNTSRINYCLKNRVPFDIQTLSRMTGRDFSGPTPEIRVPELSKPAELKEDQNQEQRQEKAEAQAEAESPSRKQRKRSKTPGITDDVEIIGDIETFNDDKSDA